MRSALLAVAVLAGCTPGYTGDASIDTALYGTRGAARQFPVGDGRTGWEVTCDGGARSMSACYQRANATCGNGFDVLSSDQNHDDGGTERSLLFVCR